MPTPETEHFQATKKRISRQVTADYNALVKNGTIVSGGLLPEEPVDGAPDARLAAPDGTPVQEPAPEPKPKAATPPEPEPETGPVWGKFKNLDEAKAGYDHTVRVSKTLSDENKNLKERLAQMQAIPAAQPTPPAPTKATPSGVLDWMKQDAVVKLAESTGIEPAQLAELADVITRQAASTVDQRVDARLTPIQTQQIAVAQFNAAHPEAMQFGAEIQAYMAAMSPDQSETVQALMEVGKVRAAMEYTYREFQREMQVAQETDLKANSQTAEASRTAKRAAASLPQQSPGTPIHAANDTTPDPKMMDQLYERSRNGDADAAQTIRRLTFGRMLPPSLRTWENPEQR